MPVGTRRVGLALAALILVVSCGLLLAVAVIPADSVRDAVKAEIRSVTGLEPVLRGGTSVSLFPTGTVSLDDVALGDKRSGITALTADHVIARLRFFPLLIGRIEIADILLVRPTITVILAPDLHSNWSEHLEALATGLQLAPRDVASFTEIRVEDGTLILQDEATTNREKLTRVDFELAWPSISRSFAATGGFVWHDQPVAASISFTDFVAALRGDRSGLKVRLTGTPLNFAFDGYVSHRPSLKMEGTVAADAVSLRDALRWTGQETPPGGGFGRFALKAQANVVGKTVSLSAAHVELDGNVGEGVLSFDGHHTLQGTLAAEGLDLTPYVSTVRLLTGGEHGWDSKPIALTGFDTVEIDLRLSAARVAVANAKLGRTAVATTLRAGHFNMAIGESEAFGGVVKGTLGLAKATAGADLKAQLQFSDVDLEQCLGELFGLRRLEGKGNLAFAIDSSGTSVYELTKGLNGTATLSSRKGAIAGFNVEQLLRRIERRPLSGRGDFRMGKTPYDALSVNLKIVDGIANVEEVRMTGAAVGLGLSGSASIPQRELDLRGTASLLSASAALPPVFELPFMVQGSWSDPIMLPDPQIRIQHSGAAAPLLDSLRNHGVPEQVRSAIERLTGSAPARPGAPGEQAPALAGTSDVAPGSPAGASAAPKSLPGQQGPSPH